MNICRSELWVHCLMLLSLQIHRPQEITCSKIRSHLHAVLGINKIPATWCGTARILGHGDGTAPNCTSKLWYQFHFPFQHPLLIIASVQVSYR